MENKTVRVKFFVEGEIRKGWVGACLVTGLDPKYGLKREFFEGEKSWVNKNTLHIDYDLVLPVGSILQTGDGGSWKNRYVGFYLVTENGLVKLKADSFTIKQLFKGEINLNEIEKEVD